MAGRLRPDTLGEVANSDVDGIRTLVANKCELCLVRSDDDGDDCCSLAYIVEGLLPEVFDID